jgi:spore maturation protein CgeB
MKITLFFSYYNNYLQSLYEQDLALAKLPYKQQLAQILADNFSWPAAVCQRLEEMGCQVQIIINVESLQRAWALENGYEFDPEKWQYTIPAEQVKRFLPDVMWIGSMFKYFGDFLGEVKPYCQRIFAWVACPITKSLDLSHIDCILTSHANYQSYFQEQGQAVEMLLPCFEKNILTESGVESPDLDCSFVGGLSWIHIERINVIKLLADRTPIQIWSDYPKLMSRGISQPKFWSAYLKLSSIRSRLNPSVWGMDMYRVLARSKITINVHAEVASGLAGNIRMFEATGMGALLITEDAPNIRDLFEPGKEVITYKSPEDLVELINYYTDKPQERAAIAQAGQARTLKDHDTVQRSKELLEIFSCHLK